MSVAARLTAEGRDAGLRGADLTLETRGADGAWRAAEWTSVDAAGASFETGAMAGALDYRARGRGLTTSARRLTAVAAPRFKSATASVHGARGGRTFVLGEDSPVKARRGDWISVRGEPDRPLASAALRLSSLPAPVPMKESGGAWTAGFLAQEDAFLSFALVLPDGRRDPSPPAFAVAVVGDAKPVAELLSPQVPLQAGPRESIAIAWSARDDGALTKVELVVKAGASTTRRALPLERGADDALGDAALPLRAYAPGSTVEFWLEAFDDASPPQSGRSEKGSVQVVDSDAAHAESGAARERALEALDRAAAAAEAAAAAAAAGKPEEAREAARPLAGRWAASAGALMAWNEAMRDDPRANPGLAEQAAAAAESLAAAGMEGLPKAEAALKEGDLARAAKEQSALAQQARAASAALREGAKLQNSQDMSDLASRAERELRESMPADLQQALAGVESALEELRKAVDALPEADAETKAVRELPLDGAREAASALREALKSGDAAGAAKAARDLAERLSRVAKGLRESGKRASSAQAGKARESATKVAQAWREAVARQEKAVEAARRRESARLSRTVAAQKDLLRRAQDAAESLLASRPSAEAEREAREASRALSLGRADEAVRRLRAAAGQERLAAVSDRPRSAAHEAAAKALDAAAAALERGAEVPAADPAASREAADAQALARSKTQLLRREVSDAAGVLGYLPGGPLRRVDDALGEQDAGEKALRAGDAAEGLRRGEAALAILQDGDKQSGEQGQSGSGMGEGSAAPSSHPAPSCAGRSARLARDLDGARAPAFGRRVPAAQGAARGARALAARAASRGAGRRDQGVLPPPRPLAIIPACLSKEPSRRSARPARTASRRRSGPSSTAARTRTCATR
ncbi:MAG: hypothetical protein M0D55_14440 [Elusimicrobiota bacterium]|nr:MAG: hypothetical protein M0D55_14440 [Elusimicrobiota bacterium]